MRSVIYICSFLIIIFGILTHPQLSLYFANQGLLLWFQKMVPALFPFMVLSNILIQMGLSEGFTTLLYPIVHSIYRVRRNVCYVMIMGFMCGFPMGAKCVTDLYLSEKINRQEAEFLLAFCNNIGPVYLISFALPCIGCTGYIIPVFGMYGIPLLYGLLLRYTKYFHGLNAALCRNDSFVQKKEGMSFIGALNDAVGSCLESILMLGGYMIIFNLLFLFPRLYLQKYENIIAPFIEITGGLSMLKADYPNYGLIMLTFCGLCCMAQTYSCLSKTDLCFWAYVKHKLLLTGCVILYYLFLRFCRLW